MEDRPSALRVIAQQEEQRPDRELRGKEDGVDDDRGPVGKENDRPFPHRFFELGLAPLAGVRELLRRLAIQGEIFRKHASVRGRGPDRVDLEDPTLEFVSDHDVGHEAGDTGRVLVERHPGRLSEFVLERRVMLREMLGEQQPSASDRVDRVRRRIGLLDDFPQIADVIFDGLLGQLRQVAGRHRALGPQRARDERHLEKLHPILGGFVETGAGFRRAVPDGETHQVQKLPPEEDRMRSVSAAWSREAQNPLFLLRQRDERHRRPVATLHGCDPDAGDDSVEPRAEDHGLLERERGQQICGIPFGGWQPVDVGYVGERADVARIDVTHQLTPNGNRSSNLKRQKSSSIGMVFRPYNELPRSGR